MVTYRSSGELEDAQDRERATARQRIDSAEQYIGDYRSRIDQVRETFYLLAAREGVSDDPAFRERLARVSDAAAENVSHAGRKVGELEEEYDAMLREHHDERERFLAQRHDTD